MASGDPVVVGYLERYAGTLPYTDEAIGRMIALFKELKDAPREMLPGMARYPMRAVFGMMPDVSLSANHICKMMDLYMDEEQLMEALHAAGPYVGEASASVLARLILGVEKGMHPTLIGRVMMIHRDDMLAIEYLLGLEERWEQVVLEKIAFDSDTRLGHIRTASRFLGTINPWVLRPWLRKARSLAWQADLT